MFLRRVTIEKKVKIKSLGHEPRDQMVSEWKPIPLEMKHQFCALTYLFKFLLSKRQNAAQFKNIIASKVRLFKYNI